MKYSLTALLAVLSLATSTAHGKEITGEDLYQACNSQDLGHRVACGLSMMSFVQGFQTAEHSHDPNKRIMCLPHGITPLTVRQAILSHLEEAGPQGRQHPMNALYVTAFIKYFPCPSPNDLP